MWLSAGFSHQPLSLHPEDLKKSRKGGLVGVLICWCRGMSWGTGLPALLLFETFTEYLTTYHLLKQNHKPHGERHPALCPWRAEPRVPCGKNRPFNWCLNLSDLRGFVFCASFSFMQVSIFKPRWYPCGVEGFCHTAKYFDSLLWRNELQAFTSTVLCRGCKPSHWFGSSLLGRGSYSLCSTTIKSLWP